MRRWNSRPNDKRQKNHFFLPPFLILNFADGPANQKRKKEKKKCSTLSAVKKRKKKRTLASDKVSKLWTCETPVACDWRVSANGNRVARMLNTHERERERDARDEHWFVTEASRLCLPLFHRVPRDGLPRGSCRQGQYIHQGAQKEIDSLFFYFWGPRKRMRLLSVLNYLAFEIFAHPPLCCICLLIQASSSYPPFPSHSFVCLFLRAWYINWQDMI